MRQRTRVSHGLLQFIVPISTVEYSYIPYRMDLTYDIHNVDEKKN